MLARFSGARDIGFTLLSDARAEIIPAFGLADPRYPKGSAFYGVSRSFILVVDAEGVVRHRFPDPYPGVDAVLDAVRGTGSS